MVTIINQPYQRKVWRGNYSEKVDTNRISVRTRDESGNRVEQVYRKDPCIYVNPSDVSHLEYQHFQGVPAIYPISSEAKFIKELREWKKEDKRVTGWEYDGTLTNDGASLLRVDFHNTQARNRFRRHFTPLYNSSMMPNEQFCVKPPISQEEFEPLFNDHPTHTLYFDLELLQFRGGNDVPRYTNMNHELHTHIIGLNQAGLQEMSLIAVYADWLDQFIVWAQHPKFSSYEISPLPREYKGRGEVRNFNDEKELLTDFVQWVETYDPDMLVAWNGDGYDLPMLWYRLEVTGVTAGKMSPYGVYEPPAPWWDEEGVKHINDSYKASKQPIRGRASLDLMPSFCKWWKSTKGQEMKRCSLDRATNDLLEEYIEVSKATEFQPNFYDKDYDLFIEDYIYYNIMDVDAMVALETYCNIIKLHLAMQNFLRVPFGSTFNSTRFCGVMFARDAGFLPPEPVWDRQYMETYKGRLKSELTYEGAEVVDVVEEGNSGVHRNVIAGDAKQMYPANIVEKNISWETAYRPDKDDPNAVTYDIHDKKGKLVVGYETVAFSTEHVGALPRIVQVVLDQRAHYRAIARKCKENGDALGEKQADNMQKAIKIIANSFYGVLGNAWAWGRDSIGLSTWALAGATTNFGKRQIHLVREYCHGLGYPTIFGHTDSVFAKMGDELTIEECVERGITLCEDISKFVQESLNHAGAEWELEQVMDSFFIAKKNRYAGRVVWADGEWVTHKPLSKRLKVSGLELKAINSSEAVGNIQLEILEMLFDGTTQKPIVRRLTEHFNSVLNGDIPLSQLAARKSIKQHLPHAYRPRGWGRAEKCNCGSCPIMVTDDMTADEKKGLRERQKKRLCYSIRGPKGSHYLRYLHGEKIWRLLNDAPAVAAWFNEFVAGETEEPITKGDSFYFIPVSDGPHPIPYRSHSDLKRQFGIVACRRLSQIKDFTIDYEVYAYDAVVSPMKNIFEGMNWSLDLISNKPVTLMQNYLYSDEEHLEILNREV